MKKNKRKNILSVLAAMIMLVATLLTACGTGETAASTDDAGTTKVETVEEETVASVETAEAEAEAVEEETTAEPTPEDTKYAGIDMESTLPGLEWMDTFDGIINEPKLVVFNDETNKKVIVENGDTVEFSLTDTMATYVPADKESSAKYMISTSFKNKEYAGRYTIETELEPGCSEIGIRFQYGNIILYGDDEVELEAELKIVE